MVDSLWSPYSSCQLNISNNLYTEWAMEDSYVLVTNLSMRNYFARAYLYLAGYVKSRGVCCWYVQGVSASTCHVVDTGVLIRYVTYIGVLWLEYPCFLGGLSCHMSVTEVNVCLMDIWGRAYADSTPDNLDNRFGSGSD